MTFFVLFIVCTCIYVLYLCYFLVTFLFFTSVFFIEILDSFLLMCIIFTDYFFLAFSGDFIISFKY